jgi:hypothetical protein
MAGGPGSSEDLAVRDSLLGNYSSFHRQSSEENGDPQRARSVAASYEHENNLEQTEKSKSDNSEGSATVNPLDEEFQAAMEYELVDERRNVNPRRQQVASLGAFLKMIFIDQQTSLIAGSRCSQTMTKVVVQMHILQNPFCGVVAGRTSGMYENQDTNIRWTHRRRVLCLRL